MATRYGKTIDGKHFSICESVRIASLRINYFIDGKRVSAHVYKSELAIAKGAERLTEIMAETHT